MRSKWGLFLGLGLGLILSAAALPIWAVEQYPVDAAPPAGKVYKSVDKNGNPVFFDSAAPIGSDNITEVKTAPANVIAPPTQPSHQDLQLFSDNAQQRAQAKQKLTQRRAKIKQIQALKAQAEKGKAPKDEEWQRTQNGRRFLKQSYYERQDQEAAKLQQEIQKIKDQ